MVAVVVGCCGCVGQLVAVGRVPIGVICDVLVVDGGMVDGFVVGSNWGRKVDFFAK